MIYRRKPVVFDAFEAVQFTYPPTKEFLEFVGPSLHKTTADRLFNRGKAKAYIFNYKDHPAMTTKITVEEGDWVMLNQSGDFTPCANQLFESLYEKVET